MPDAPYLSDLAGCEVVYFIQAGEAGPIKIGYSAMAEGVAGRLGALQCGNPERLVLRRVVTGTRLLEYEIHERLARWRLEGEWFANVIEVAKIAHAPCLPRGSWIRTLLPWIDRTFEAGRRVGHAEAEAELYGAISDDLDQLRERWRREPLENIDDLLARSRATIEDIKAKATVTANGSASDAPQNLPTANG